jgi:hypothetical protein
MTLAEAAALADAQLDAALAICARRGFADESQRIAVAAALLQAIAANQLAAAWQARADGRRFLDETLVQRDA